MPHILMLTPYLPYPPVSGGRMRTYNLVKHLAGEYEITLVCFGRPEEQAFDLGPMRELCELVVIARSPSPGVLQAALLSLTTIKPLTMRLYASSEMRRTVAQFLSDGHFDAIHVESFYMLQNVPPRTKVPILLSEPAIEYIAWRRHAQVARPVLQRPGIALEALKMRFFEPRAWHRADLVGAMSELDAGIIRRAAPSVGITLAPNGVDIEFFRPGDGTSGSANAVFMGDYKYFPNTDAALYFIGEIMPLIRAHQPDFTLTLLGKDPPPELIAFGRDPASGVVVTGLVEDTRPYLTRAGVFICPLRSGSGTRFKLLEALACGLPVVTTTIGCEGLDPVNGRHMLLADSPRDFADSVLKIMADPGYAHALAQEGCQWVVENYAWKRSAALVAGAYRQLMGRSRENYASRSSH